MQNGYETKEHIDFTVSFEARYTQHKYSFKYSYSSHTILSKYVRKFSKSDIKVAWSIINKIFKGIAKT